MIDAKDSSAFAISKITRLRWIWLGVSVLVLSFAYLWIVPLIWPRGDLLWGYYRLKDLLLGIPVGLAVLCILAILASPSRYKRHLAAKLTTILVSSLAMLFICDFAYAFLIRDGLRPNFWLDQGHIPRKYSMPDSELGFARKPEISWRRHVPELNRFVDYRTDENGFRNPPRIPQADIVFIGDSYTEAAQVTEEETFARRVAAALGVTSVNLGRGAYGPQQEFIVLERYGLKYRPRLVVWQLFEGNDLGDANIFAEWKKDPEQSLSLKERYFNYSLLTEWLKKTRLSEAPLVTVRHNNGATQRMRLRYRYEPRQPDEIPLGFAETRRVVEEGQQLCLSQNARLIILFVPTMVRVLEPYITFDRIEDRNTYLPVDAVQAKRDFRARLAELCSEIGCTFVDAFEMLRVAAALNNQNLYIPNDEHLDVGGHEVIARILIDRFASEERARASTGSATQ